MSNCCFQLTIQHQHHLHLIFNSLSHSFHSIHKHYCYSYQLNSEFQYLLSTQFITHTLQTQHIQYTSNNTNHYAFTQHHSHLIIILHSIHHSSFLHSFHNSNHLCYSIYHHLLQMLLLTYTSIQILLHLIIIHSFNHYSQIKLNHNHQINTYLPIHIHSTQRNSFNHFSHSNSFNHFSHSNSFNHFSHSFSPIKSTS